MRVRLALRVPVVVHRGLRRPAAMTGLDVIAAGISLPVSGLRHWLCSVA
jgi:hypothetical protein